MTSIRHRDGMLAAHALLVDMTLNPDPDSAERLALVLKLAKYPVVLATIAVKVFDQVGRFPDIVDDIKLLAGREDALEYGTALQDIDRLRNQQGKERLPIRFTDEAGRPNNILFISDFQHLRKVAA